MTTDSPQGVYVPLVTTFDGSGRVDLPALDPIVEAMIAAGVHGLVACGTTGEGYALSLEERRAVTAHIKEATNGRVPVLGGVGGMSTDQALDHALLARALELDGLMVAAPAYCLPTQTELATHVRAVIDAAGLPTVLYDYPQRTGVSFDIESLDVLAKEPSIVGIKEASGDLDRVSTLMARYGEDLPVICGADAAAPQFLDAGVQCWIGGIANLLPAAHVAMLDPKQRSSVFAAIHPLLEYIEQGGYIPKVKAGMEHRGLAVGSTRAPLSACSSEEKQHLAELLDRAGDWARQLRVD